MATASLAVMHNYMESHMLIKCPECGKEISKSAMICPHCKRSTQSSEKKEMRPCRICKTPLVVKDHLSVAYKSDPSIVVGNSVSSSMKYTPCPNCGEPKPILPGAQTSPMKPLLLIFILLTLIGVVAVSYFKFVAK